MKIKNMCLSRIALFIMLFPFLFVSCSDSDNDSRSYEVARIVGVKVAGQLYTPTYTDGETTVIVPPGRDLSNVKLQVLVANGELVNFENNVDFDCSKPIDLTIQAFDGQSVVTKLKIQSPPKLATFIISGMSISNENIRVSGSSILVELTGGTDLTALKVTIEFVNGTLVDFENEIAMDYTNPKTVKVEGKDGTIYSYELIITCPQWNVQQLFAKKYDDLGIGANDLSAVGFSGSYVLVSNYTANEKTPAYYNLKGEKKGTLNADGCTNVGYGFRKFATDAKGTIIGSSLGMSADEQWIYKWDNVTATPKEYISFSKATLGVSYSPRAAGLNVMGTLDGDAVVVMPLAQQKDVVIWTITKGVVGAPKVVHFSVAFGYYASVEPLPNNSGFMVASGSGGLTGLAYMNANFEEEFRISGATTDCRVIDHKEKRYLAYTVLLDSNQPVMRICDITDGAKKSFEVPIFETLMSQKAANGNLTMDADLAIVDGKLHVAFVSSNSNFYLYSLE